MSDYLYRLESRLNPRQVQLLAEVQQVAERAGAHLFLVGGAVRDLAAGLAIRDLDFAVEAPALKLIRQLDRRRFSVLSTDPQRQSAELLYAGLATAEIAMCRTETYTKTGARPEVAPATIQEDLRRRDFTVNAVALSLNPGSRGLVLDPTNGLADIEHKELRTPYNHSFYDDPARLLRLVRLASRLKYSVEPRTKSQYDSALEAGLLEHVPPRARLRELEQLALEPDATDAVKALAGAGLLGLFEPHLPKKIDPRALSRLEKCRRLIESSDLRVEFFGAFLYCLTQKLSPAEKANLRTRTAMRAAEAGPWTRLESQAKTLQKTLAGKQAAQNSRLYRILSAEDPAAALFLMAFSPQQPVRERIKTYFTKLRPLARDLTDQEIEQQGVKRDSPKFASVREAYLMARLDKKTHRKVLSSSLRA